MSNFEFDQNKKELTFILAAVILLVAGVFMFFGSLSKFSVNGTKNEKGRVEISVTDYFLYIIPYKSETISPVTNARFISGKEEIDRYLKQIEGDKIIDASFKPFAVIFTTKDEYRLDGKRADYPLEEKISFFTDLDSFITDPEQTDFNKSFGNFGFSGILGLIFMAGSLVFVVPKVKNIKQLVLTEIKKIDFSKQIKEIKPQIKKKEVKPGKDKEDKTFEVKPIVSKTLRVLIPAYLKDIRYDVNIFKLPEIDEIAFACTSEQKQELELKYKNEHKYIICDNIKGTADMILKTEEWLKDYTGYIFVQTAGLPDITLAQISRIFKDHREKDCECTFLSRESFEKKIQKGKVLRSVANKIIKISEIQEVNENPDQPAEIFAGLFCLNTKNLFKVLAKMNISMSSLEVPLTRIVEIYYRNGYRVNSYPLTVSGSAAQQNNQQPVFERKKETMKKTNAVVILSVDNPEINHAKISFGLASAIDDNDRIGIITSKASFEEYKMFFEGKAEIFSSDNGLGDGYDVLTTETWLKGFKGNVTIIPEDNADITPEMIYNLISEHSGRENTCTYYKLADKNILCCVNSDYFIYSAKRIIKDDQTKKYYLSQITEILENDKKRVQEIIQET
jgi:bifunctional N-acetylglucosamine-1-phosphate-uridyltransferase/glucosamine-1-phosphate-acetyltransferase GlmU-like protein